MQGNEKILVALNELLADELTAISQYMVHSEMCDNWGYEKLHKAKEKQAIEEMGHAELLIQRILFLDGIPIVSKLHPMTIGKHVPEMIANDQKLELGAVSAYNRAIRLAHEVDDQATVDLMTRIVKDEEAHEDWAEIQLTQIEHVGLGDYLAIQSGGAAG
jgi:bacterioferritin